jgi:hypothetical protein
VGGGSDSATSPTNLDTTVSGKAVDGYLRYSTVCLDLSKDGYCQNTEPMTLTEEDGSFTLTVSSDHKAHANYSTAQLLVYGGQDSDTGTDFIGKLKAPNDGETINVTPLTTLVAEIVADTTTTTTVAEAKEKVAHVFGIDASKVSSDPIELAKTDGSVLSAALQVQKAVEKMVESSSATNQKDDSAKIFAALASEIKATDVAANQVPITTIIENKKEAIQIAVTTVTDNQITQSKEVVAVVKVLIPETKAPVTNTSTVATQIEYAKENNTAASAISSVNTDTIAIDGVKKLFAGLGITWSDSYNDLATQETIKPNMTLAQIKAATTNTTIIAAVDAKLAAIEFAQNSTALTKTSLDAMFAESNIKADADVNSAKLMIKNIRELGTSLYDGDAKTGLVVDQEALITAEVEKIVANSKNKIKATEQNLKTMLENFQTTVDTDLNAPTTALETRLQTISEAMDIEEAKIADGATGTFTVDGITVKMTKNSDGDATLVELVSAATISGDGYSVKVTSMKFSEVSDSRFTFVMNGEATLKKGTTEFIGKIVADINNDESKGEYGFNKILLTLTGDLTSDGRAFNGKLLLSGADSSYSLEGKLAGKTGEPTLEGKIVLGTKLLDLQKINGDLETYWTDYSNYNNGVSTWNYNYPPVIASGTSYVLNTTGTKDSEYNLDKFIFPVMVDGKKDYIDGMGVWLNSYNSLSNQNVSFYLHNSWDNINLIDGKYYKLDYSNYDYSNYNPNYEPIKTEVTVSFLPPESKVSFDNIAKSIAFSGSVKDTNVEASFDIFINSLGDDNLDQVLIKNLNYKDDKLVIAADTFEMKNTIANEVETDTISLKSLTVNGGTINLSLSGDGSSAMKDDKELSSSLNAKFVFANGAASLDGELKSTTTYNTCGDESAYDVSFVGKLTANDFVPFKILVGSTGGIVGTAVSENSYLLLDRNGYKLALTDTASETYNATSCQMTNKTHSISGIDSNGVKVNSTDAKAFTMTNKAGTTPPLGTVTNGIVTYSDNTGESVF